MVTKLFFENKQTGKKYEVLHVDKSTNPAMLTLQGEVSKFTQVFDKDLLKRCGYELVKIEVDEDDRQQS